MSRLFHITLIILVLLGLPMLLIDIFSSVAISPVGGGLGLVFGVLYGLLWILILRASAAWPGAGWWWLSASLLWGGGVSFLLVVIGGLPIFEVAEKLNWTLTLASWGGAYPEEIGKSLGVAVILLSFRRLTRPWHGFITGAVVGLGFEVMENLPYGAYGGILDPNSDLDGALITWVSRIVLGPGLHVAFSAIAGWGIGWAIFAARRSALWRWSVASLWVFLAFAFHFTWNLMWEDYRLQLVTMAVVAVLMYPLFIWLYWTSHRLAKQDPTQVALPVMITSLAGLAAYRRSRDTPARAPVTVADRPGDQAAGTVSPGSGAE